MNNNTTQAEKHLNEAAQLDCLPSVEILNTLYTSTNDTIKSLICKFIIASNHLEIAIKAEQDTQMNSATNTLKEDAQEDAQIEQRIKKARISNSWDK